MADQTNDIEVVLSEPQTDIMEARKSTILNMSGQGGGKSQIIGYTSGMLLQEFPQARGFIGANTYQQLSHSTLAAVFKTWRNIYGLYEYDKRANPGGAYVVDKKPPLHFERFHEVRDYEGTISFWNGAMAFIGSLENYKAHDGKEFAWGQLDETKDTKPEALTDVIMGRLRQYGLWYHRLTGEIFFDDRIGAPEAESRNWEAWNPLYIHTSPAEGTVQWLNEMFRLDKFAKEIKNAVVQKDRDYFYKEFEDKAVCIYSAYHNAPNLPPNYFQAQENRLMYEDKILKLVHGYPFSKTGGEWYPYWSREKHVGHVPFIPGLAVHQGWDFNVVPFMTLVCTQLEFVTRYLDEMGKKHDQPEPGYKAIEVMRIRVYKGYFLGGERSSTEAVCEAFSDDHDPNTTEVLYYGDAHGLRRIPGLGSVTNYKIIAEKLYPYLHNDSKQVRDPNVGVWKRRDLVNMILADKIPTVELIVDEGCQELIDDMEYTKTTAKGKDKERSSDKNVGEKRGHPSDALEYIVSEVCKHHIIG